MKTAGRAGIRQILNAIYEKIAHNARFSREKYFAGVKYTLEIMLVCAGAKQKNYHALIKSCYPYSNIESFSGVAAALGHINKPGTHVDICFTEIVIGGESGFRFIELLRRRSKRTKVVFIAPDDQFALEGWRYGMSDYLIEPLTIDSIRHTLVSCAADIG